MGGRIRMPYNNRVSTSGALRTNDIWRKTIGYDPHASHSEFETQEIISEEKKRSLMELVRHQSATCMPSINDEYAKKMFFGLKVAKKNQYYGKDRSCSLNLETAKILQDESSSSEERYIWVEDNEKNSQDSSTKRSKTRKMKDNKKRKHKSKIIHRLHYRNQERKKKTRRSL